MEPPKQGQPGFELRPPGAHDAVVSDKTGGRAGVWAALAVVVALGLAVLLVLPKLVSTNPDGAGPDAAEAVAAVSPQEQAQQAANARADAEQALQDFLRLQARLELANAPAWGEPEWSLALDTSAKGNDLFGQRRFAESAQVLSGAKALLVLLESERGQRLENALNSGWQALQDGDSSAAGAYFELALSIESDNEDALAGLQRARARPDVLNQMEAGELALSVGDLPGARDAFRQALALDEAYGPAETALNSVNEQITELAFREAMSRALSALDQERVSAAEAALEQAAGLKPGDEAVRNTRQQLAQTRQRLWLAGQREKAAGQERKEDWSGAVATYREVLAKVPQAGFASQGRAFAEDRVRLHGQFDHYLDRPDRLFADEPRLNAEELLAAAGTAPVAEPRLADKISRLKRLLADARTPLNITLKSDGLTQVLIYHIGRLGQFTSQQLELLPGTYTIVGSRPGYRDVRRTVTLKPGSNQPVLDIRCEEPI